LSEQKDVLICRCNEVTLKEIEQAIDDGFVTLNEIKRRTRAGMGLCQGRTCGKLVARLIAQRTGKKISDIKSVNRRMPVRPVKMDLFEGK
jgi:NAD(P)H-nitrite reductase large subunit